MGKKTIKPTFEEHKTIEMKQKNKREKEHIKSKHIAERKQRWMEVIRPSFSSNSEPYHSHLKSYSQIWMINRQ